jgi:hypothetical protein
VRHSINKQLSIHNTIVMDIPEWLDEWVKSPLGMQARAEQTDWGSLLSSVNTYVLTQLPFTVKMTPMQAICNIYQPFVREYKIIPHGSLYPFVTLTKRSKKISKKQFLPYLSTVYMQPDYSTFASPLRTWIEHPNMDLLLNPVPPIFKVSRPKFLSKKWYRVLPDGYTTIGPTAPGAVSMRHAIEQNYMFKKADREPPVMCEPTTVRKCDRSDAANRRALKEVYKLLGERNFNDASKTMLSGLLEAAGSKNADYITDVIWNACLSSAGGMKYSCTDDLKLSKKDKEFLKSVGFTKAATYK